MISMQNVKFLHLKLSDVYSYFVITYVMIFSFRLNSNSHLLHTYAFQYMYHEKFVNWHNNSLANMTNVNKCMNSAVKDIFKSSNFIYFFNLLKLYLMETASEQRITQQAPSHMAANEVTSLFIAHLINISNNTQYKYMSKQVTRTIKPTANPSTL